MRGDGCGAFRVLKRILVCHCLKHFIFGSVDLDLGWVLVGRILKLLGDGDGVQALTFGALNRPIFFVNLQLLVSKVVVNLVVHQLLHLLCLGFICGHAFDHVGEHVQLFQLVRVNFHFDSFTQCGSNLLQQVVGDHDGSVVGIQEWVTFGIYKYLVAKLIFQYLHLKLLHQLPQDCLLCRVIHVRVIQHGK